MEKTLIDTMCLAIQEHEGWFAPCPQYPNGSTSYRNNNPGNLKYFRQVGSIGKDAKGFTIFTSYQAGYNALKNQIMIVAKGKSGAYPKVCTIQQFFAIYAPAFENNVDVYAKFVANKMGVGTDFLLSNLVTSVV